MEIPANMQLKESSRNAILAAANRLNAVCDGARTNDQHGFNKGDTDWFKYWLSRDNIKDGVIVHMHQKLRLYRKQLFRYGIDYEQINPEFEAKPEPAVIKIDPTWEEFKMPFGKYKDKTMAEIVKTDKSYLDFIYVKFDDGPVRDAAKAVLAGQPITKNIPKAVVPKDANKNDYIFLDVEGDDKIVFHSSKSYKDEIKALHVARWNEDNDYKWKAPMSALDEVLEAFPNAPKSDKLRDILKRREELRTKSRAMVNTREFDLGGFGNGKEMMPFQKAGLEFMELTKGRMLLADEAGTGKTIQIMSYLQLHPEIRPAVIVCPASIKFNWRNEINAWMTRGDKVQVANRGAIPKPTKKGKVDSDIAFTGDILIINYDILGKWAERIAAREPKFIAFDESHLLKNRNAGRTRVAKEIVQSLNIPHVIEATGTPVLNRPAELYSQLHILNPKAYPEDGLHFINYAKI